MQRTIQIGACTIVASKIVYIKTWEYSDGKHPKPFYLTITFVDKISLDFSFASKNERDAMKNEIVTIIEHL
jgi:hypothetical protein